MLKKKIWWLAGWLAGWAALAHATTMIVADEQKLASAADLVVVGRVESTAPVPDAARRGGVQTNTVLTIREIWRGHAERGTIVISEQGGDLGEISERYFGVPEYRTGEVVLGFLTRRVGGGWQTLGMAMGKFSVVEGSAGSLAIRDLGAGTDALEWDGGTLRRVPGRAVYRLEDLRQSVQATLQKRMAPRAEPLETEDVDDLEQYVAPFGLMGSPGRWFEVDEGAPVGFWVDANGDSGLGFAATSRAVDRAMAAWSNVPTAKIQLQNLGAREPAPPDCRGPSQILFNDPTNSISDPFFCSGVLALGGYCTTSEEMVVNGVNFRRITVGKIVFNNGWEVCPFWNECNVAEVVTHELGHAIGIGHSENSRATMFAYAHFDGRCASLRADDVAAVSFIYPASESMHDVVLETPRPVRAVIRAGSAEAVVPVSVTVRHADWWGGGAWIRLQAEDGSCPAGTVEKVDFATFSEGDRVYVPPAGEAKGVLSLRLRSDAFTSRDPKAPARCVVELSASAEEAGNMDPYPGNERAAVIVDVTDKNDLNSKLKPVQVALRTVKPVFMRIPLGRTEALKRVNVPVRSAAAVQTVSVRVETSDCPSGIITGVVLPRSVAPFTDVAMGANSTRTAQVLLRADRSLWTSLFAGSPARCSAMLVVESDLTDPDLSNNVLPLLIDVQDDNDI